MAFSDYHACDNCSERKSFYDADMDMEWVDGEWRYGYAKGGARTIRLIPAIASMPSAMSARKPTRS